MKRIITSLVAISIFLLMFVSCYYDNEEALYPTLTSSCDTINVTFSGTIATILNNNCFSCHSNSTAPSSGNNIALQNYADVVAQSALIVASVKHTGTISPMPKNGGSIKVCSITQIDIWVRKGMPDN